MKVKEEMDSLKRALHDASRERDKAVQDLARLKQHLLDKVTTYNYLVVEIRKIRLSLLHFYFLNTSYVQYLMQNVVSYLKEQYNVKLMSKFCTLIRTLRTKKRWTKIVNSLKNCG